MSEAKERAFADLKRMGAMLSGIISLTEELELVATLDEMLVSAQAKLDAVNEDGNKAIERVAAQQREVNIEINGSIAELKELQTKAAGQRTLLAIELQDHEKACSDLKVRSIEDAERRAKAIIQKAMDDAETNIDTAQRAAQQLHETNNELMAAQGRLAEIKVEIAKLASKFGR